MDLLEIIEKLLATRQTDVSTSVIQIPTTTTTPPIIPNRREMRGFVIVVS